LSSANNLIFFRPNPAYNNICFSVEFGKTHKLCCPRTLQI
jgi:hypothetical protein